MKKLRIGIIGTGSIGKFHIDAYRRAAADEAEVVAVCDIDEAKAKRFAEDNGVSAYYKDCREMLAAEKLDAVSVCTWNAAHRDCTVAALEAGAHVLCEKPMAMNEAEAKEMADAAEKAGKLLQIGFVRRFGTDAENMLDFVRGGVLGDIYYAKATYLRRDGCPAGWFCDKAYSGGGPLIDLGVHVIDLVRYLSGSPKPTEVFGVTYKGLGKNRARGAETAWTRDEGSDYPYTVEDFTSAMVRFDSGMTLAVEASFSLNIPRDTGIIELYGTKAGAALADGEIQLYTDMCGKYVNVQTVGGCGGTGDFFGKEILGFVRAASGTEPCRSSAEDGVMLMKIIDAIYKSAETGKSVTIAY